MNEKFQFDKKPLIVFWETTKACLLACKHCRASAIKERLHSELTEEEGYRLIDDIKKFGKPYPILIMTGGDVLMRDDCFRIAKYASENGITVSMAPSVTPLLNSYSIKQIARSGVSSISISLDSPYKEVHDSIRGYEGCWDKTIKSIIKAIKEGLKVQVNTVVMRSNIKSMARMFHLIKNLGVRTWEVFFLVRTGRGMEIEKEEVTPLEYEELSHFLYDASAYGIRIRTAEGPHFRRVVLQRKAGYAPYAKGNGSLYRALSKELKKLEGKPTSENLASITPTRDGKGVVFVSYKGDIMPSGFLPISGGNTREDSLVKIYQTSKLFLSLRNDEMLKGRCGRCEFKSICGGSRARAFSVYNDPFQEDPACPYLT